MAELQEILEMGQSRISSHLGLLRRHDMVSDRKDGKKTFYNLNTKVAQRSDLIKFALAEESEEEFWKTDHIFMTDNEIDEFKQNLEFYRHVEGS